jgi:hypothetical protein
MSEAAAKTPGGPLVAVLVSIILTLVGLLAWVVRLIIVGRLVPGGERDYWREFAFEEQRQKATLMTTARVVEGVVSALPDAPPGGETG